MCALLQTTLALNIAHANVVFSTCASLAPGSLLRSSHVKLISFNISVTLSAKLTSKPLASSTDLRLARRQIAASMHLKCISNARQTPFVGTPGHRDQRKRGKAAT